MRMKWLDEEGEPLPSSRMVWLDLAVMTVSLAEASVGNLATFVGGVKSLIQQHYNWTVDRDEFHEEASIELETIMEGDTDG